MPLGLCSAPATFQLVMVLAGLKWQTCIVNLDVVSARNFRDHLRWLGNDPSLQQGFVEMSVSYDIACF